MLSPLSAVGESACQNVSPLKKVKRGAAAQHRPARNDRPYGLKGGSLQTEKAPACLKTLFRIDGCGQSVRAGRCAGHMRRMPGRAALCETNKKGFSLLTEAIVFQNWCRGRDSNPHSYCHYPLKIACLPVPPPRRQKALYAKPRRLASLFSAFFPFRPRLFRLRAGASGGGTWSIFSLKCCTFQTIRPVVSWKKHGFSAHFGPGGAVPQLRVLP